MYSPHGCQYGRRGFAVGALMFALGLIGVVGGTMFSSTTQGLMLSVKMQNSVQDRTTVGNAIRQLAASSVIGTDGATLCPPRSSVSGTACGGLSDTPVMLQSLSEIAPTDAHMPSGYDAVDTGSPVDIAIFAPASGLPQTDSSGRYWIVCRWEQPDNDPAARAFAVIGAGRDGIAQTRCGDTAASGDDVFAPVTVALTVAHLDSWQLIGGKAQFGATGKQVTVDADGNIIATSLTASGAINGGAGQFASVVSSGSITANAAMLGDITATSLSSSGSIYGAAGHFTSINDAGSLVVTGASTLDSVAASSFTTSGTLTAGTATLGNVSAALISASGDINTTRYYRINGAQIAASNLANGTTGSGNIVLADSPALSGTLTGDNATFSGTVTAAAFAGGGVDLSSGGVICTG